MAMDGINDLRNPLEFKFRQTDTPVMQCDAQNAKRPTAGSLEHINAPSANFLTT